MSVAVVRSYLEHAGPTRAGALARGLALPASSLRRFLGALGDDLLVVGKARATTYAVRRSIEGVRAPVPVYEVRPDGSVRPACRLHPVQPFGHFVESQCDDVSSGFHETEPASGRGRVDLPWFLQDLKPEGYLGRAWLRGHAEQGFPAKLSQWGGDEVLRYAVEQGVDLPGAWVVGALQRARLAEPRAAETGTLTKLALRSATVVFGGSSPGGEQPKFTFRDAQGRAKLVKFSPPTDERSGARWADLLLAEHLAARLLAAHGVDACASEVVDEGDRRFLVVDRFDRHGAEGRSGVASLASLDADGVGSEARSWQRVTAELVDRGWVGPEVHERVVWLEAFGHMIANSDMHMGNLSMRLEGATLSGLAPVYDMLPMFHAPRHGVLVDQVYMPQSHLDSFPGDALGLARRFWEALRSDPRQLGTLDAVCEAQLGVLG